MRVRSCDFTPVCDLCTIDPFPIPPSTQNFREDAPFPPFISTDRFSLSRLSSSLEAAEKRACPASVEVVNFSSGSVRILYTSKP